MIASVAPALAWQYADAFCDMVSSWDGRASNQATASSGVCTDVPAPWASRFTKWMVKAAPGGLACPLVSMAAAFSSREPFSGSNAGVSLSRKTSFFRRAPDHTRNSCRHFNIVLSSARNIIEENFLR